MNYIILKGKDWPYGYEGGAESTDSAAYTHTGRQVGIMVSYFTKEKADQDCAAMNEYNPVGHYFVTDDFIKG